ncbi:MAG: heme ABC exporter ATP-binding protein CcmA [Acidimicrobiales bacterium]|nr:MAG: heme ABC exporter ATP-binding protein CcmA [Acidimicrobiales bacterium]
MEAAAIAVKNLVVTRGGRRVLHQLNVDIPRGHITGLLGPSGCGKTTLMRCVVGVQRVESGTVTVLGDAAGSAALRRRVGYVTQSPSVYADLSVADNLSYFASLFGASKQRVRKTMSDVELSDSANQLVSQLSGGQRTRVSLACALISEPELLVLDEPTVGLDPVLRAQLWQQFHELADSGVTVLLSSHVMDEATHCHRLLLMRDGSFVADDTPDALLSQTATLDLESAFLALVSDRTDSQEA